MSHVQSLSSRKQIFDELISRGFLRLYEPRCSNIVDKQRDNRVSVFSPVLSPTSTKSIPIDWKTDQFRWRYPSQGANQISLESKAVTRLSGVFTSVVVEFRVAMNYHKIIYREKFYSMNCYLILNRHRTHRTTLSLYNGSRE